MTKKLSAVDTSVYEKALQDALTKHIKTAVEDIARREARDTARTMVESLVAGRSERAKAFKKEFLDAIEKELYKQIPAMAKDAIDWWIQR